MISGGGVNIRKLSHYHFINNFSPDERAMHHKATLNPLAEEFIPTRGCGMSTWDRKEPVVGHSRTEGTLNPLADEFRPAQRCLVHMDGRGQKYTLNPHANKFVPRQTSDVYTKYIGHIGGTNHKGSDGVRALTDQTNECIENDVPDLDRVDREVINDRTDVCNVPPNGGDINVYVNELSDHESPDGGGHVIRWTDNVTVCDFTVVKGVQNEVMALKYKNLEGGWGCLTGVMDMREGLP